MLPSSRSLQNSSCAALAAATISSPARRKRFACRIFARGFWAGSASSSMTAFFSWRLFFYSAAERTSDLVRVPREQFQEAVRSLHVPERALLGRASF